MSKLDDLKEMKIPNFNPELSSESHESVVLIAVGTRSRAKDVFKGVIKEEKDKDGHNFCIEEYQVRVVVVRARLHLI